MKIVLHVSSTRHADDRNGISVSGFRPAIQSLLAQRNRLNVDTVFVFSDIPGIIGISSSYKELSAHRIPTFPDSGKIDFIDPAMWCSRFLLQEKKISKDDDILFIDFKNRISNLKVYEKARNDYMRSRKRLLCGIEKCRDHPCQFDVCYKLLENDLYAPTDHTPLVRRVPRMLKVHKAVLVSSLHAQYDQLMVTKPFFNDWRLYGVWEKRASTIFARIQSGVSSYFVPLEEIEAARKLTSAPVIGWYCYENATMMRRIVRRGETGNDKHRSRFVPCVNPYDMPNYLFYEDSEKRTIDIWMKGGDKPGDRLLRIRPVYSDKTIGDALDIHAADSGAPRFVPQGDKQSRYHFFATVSAEPYGHPELSQLIVTLLELSRDHTCDIEEPLDMCPQLWTIDRKTKKRRNTRTQNEIAGRQEFPEIYELNGGLVIFKAENSDTLAEDLSSGGARGFLIHPDDAAES